MKYTDEQIHSYEKRLIENNKKIWPAREDSYSDGCVVVVHSLLHELNFCVLEDIITRKLSSFTRNKPISLQFREYRKSIELLDQSFGIEPIFYDWNTVDISKEKSVNTFIKQYHSKKEIRALLANLEYKGIKYGDILYSEVLRKKVISVENDSIISDKQFAIWMLTSLTTIDIAYDFFENNKCSSIVVCEWGYTCGLFARVAQEFGVYIYVVDTLRPNYLAKIFPECKLFDDIKVADIIKIRGDCCASVLKSGDDLFVFKRADYEKKINIKRNGKHNVFILPHAFIDNSRTGDHMDVYFSYYDWFIETLEIIKNIKDTNWYIKDHPESAFYGQGKLMKAIEERYLSDNITWLKKDFSGRQISEYADCVVTCAGDTGIEYWIKGIPTITAANAYYVDWGVSYNAKTKEEYRDLLLNSGNLQKPSDYSIELAKEKLLRSSIYFKRENNILDIFYDTRVRQLEQYRLDVFRNDNTVYFEFANSICEINDCSEFDVLGKDEFEVSADTKR